MSGRCRPYAKDCADVRGALLISYRGKKRTKAKAVHMEPDQDLMTKSGGTKPCTEAVNAKLTPTSPQLEPQQPPSQQYQCQQITYQSPPQKSDAPPTCITCTQSQIPPRGGLEPYMMAPHSRTKVNMTFDRETTNAPSQYSQQGASGPVGRLPSIADMLMGIGPYGHLVTRRPSAAQQADPEPDYTYSAPDPTFGKPAGIKRS